MRVQSPPFILDSPAHIYRRVIQNVVEVSEGGGVADHRMRIYE